MNVIKSNFLLLIVCLTGVCGACHGGNFHPRPEDKVVRLDKFGESPKGKARDYKIGDEVSVIADNGEFFVKRQIDETCEKLIFAPENFNGKGKKKWMPFEKSHFYDTGINNRDIEKTAPKGYRVVSGGRSQSYDWFPPEQIFPVPWANNVSLKVGDTVYEKGYGYSDPRKGVVAELPVNEYGSFQVRFGEDKISTEVRSSDIFSSIVQATREDLSPGEIVYYDKTTWAIVIGKRDDKIIIRQEQNSFGDIVVDVSKLQILK